MSRALEVPSEIAPLIAALVERASPKTIWLFGSRARGDHRPDSDWDLVVALDNDAPAHLFEPLLYWLLRRSLGIEATILPISEQDLIDCWGQPNTLGYDLARDGRPLDVRR